jgi:hypothetical protein
MWLAIALIVVLVLGAVGVVLWQADTDDVATEFPIGRFVHEEFPSQVMLTFDEDGTWQILNWGTTVSGKYAVNGDLYTEMTHSMASLQQVPATYTWTYDGENLTFVLHGEDVVLPRRDVLDGQTYIRTE